MKKINRRNATIVGAGIILAGAAGVAVEEHDSHTTGVNLKALSALQAEPEQQDSHNSLITFLLLDYAESESDARSIANASTPFDVTYQIRPRPNVPTNGFPDRVDLIDVEMQDPQYPHDKSKRKSFKMIAHHANTNSLNAYVMYNPASKELIFEFPGYDYNVYDIIALDKMRLGQIDPAISAIPNFMQDAIEQLQNGKEHGMIIDGKQVAVEVEKTSLFAHSMGAGPAVAALKYIEDHASQFNELLGDQPVETLLFEGLYETVMPVRDASHITSIRHLPATYIGGRADNPPAGEKALAIVPLELYTQKDLGIIERQTQHSSKESALQLYKGETRIVAATKEQISYPMAQTTGLGQFVMDYPPEEHIGIGIIVVSLLIVGGRALKKIIGRRNKHINQPVQN
jgi:hypothetical protein